MAKPPSIETQLKTARREVRELRGENYRLTRERHDARAAVLALEAALQDARSTIETLRKAVDALTARGPAG